MTERSVAWCLDSLNSQLFLPTAKPFKGLLKLEGTHPVCFCAHFTWIFSNIKMLSKHCQISKQNFNYCTIHTTLRDIDQLTVKIQVISPGLIQSHKGFCWWGGGGNHKGNKTDVSKQADNKTYFISPEDQI